MKQAMAWTTQASPASLSLAAVWGFPVACLGSLPDSSSTQKQAALTLWQGQVEQVDRLVYTLLRALTEVCSGMCDVTGLHMSAPSTRTIVDKRHLT